MAVMTTIGDAYAAKWGIRMRCLRGNHRGIVKIDPCLFEADLSIETLVCTRLHDVHKVRLLCLVSGDMADVRVEKKEGN
jgi:hypothetical protein